MKNLRDKLYVKKHNKIWRSMDKMISGLVCAQCGAKIDGTIYMQVGKNVLEPLKRQVNEES